MTSVRFFLSLTLSVFFSSAAFADTANEGSAVIYFGARACSSTLFRLPSMNDDSPVHLLTAGHCSFGTNVNAALLDNTLTEVTVIQNVRRLHTQVDSLDVSLYSLPITYAQLRERYGIRPLPLATGPAPIGGDVTIVSSIWVEQHHCRVERQVALREASYNWRQALRMDEDCVARTGFSGGQIVSPQNEIVGIIHTMNEQGEHCTINNPCEISNGQSQVLANRAYGMQTSGITRCFNENGVFDLYLAQCPLTH